MKNFERKDKNERRRVLLSKNNELSYSYRKEKLLQDDEAVRENGPGVMAKMGVLTQKQLRAIIAILVAICVVLPGMFFFALHGKAAGSLENGNKIVFSGNRFDVPEEGLEAGSYLAEWNGKDWTYNLERDYTYGDYLTMDSSSGRITVHHNPGTNNQLELITDHVNATNIDPTGDTIDITLGEGESLAPDTLYKYTYNDKYYIFSFPNEVIGWVAGDQYNDSHASDVRQHSDPEQNDKVTIQIDKETGVATYSSDSSGYDRRTIYHEVDNFEEDGVYLITLIQGTIGEEDYDEYIMSYGWEALSGSKKTAYSTRRSNTLGNIQIGGNSSFAHTAYSLIAEEAFPSSFADAPKFYDVTYAEKTYSQDKFYYDNTDASIQELMLNDSRALPEFQAKATGSYWQLRGLITSSNGETYSANKTFGSLYNKDFSIISSLADYNEDLYYSFFLFDVDLITQGTNGTYFLWEDNTFSSDVFLENVNLKDGTYWEYSDGKLVNNPYALNSKNGQAKYLGVVEPSENDENPFTGIARDATGNANKLYKMEDVYVKTTLPSLTGYRDAESDDYYDPSIISYTDSSQSVEGLKTNKTVSTTSDPDIFHVKLEGYMTEQTIKLPTTDIVLTLDLSGRMNDTLYNREYKNLKTQALFNEVKLSDVTHDSLFDPKNGRNSGQWSIASGERTYTDNKYIEDPNSPGTYVYLAQTYVRDGRNYYQYSFTSLNGTVYKSPKYSRSIWASVINKVESITFTRVGNNQNAIRSITIDSFYERSGVNADSTLTDQRTSDNSNTSLYDYSVSDGGLWYKHTDGSYHQVTVTRKDLDKPRPNDSSYDYYKNYEYSVEVEGKTYTVTYGNELYGAKNSVFQGFKKYTTDDNGKLIVNQEESLPGKTLYTYVGSDSEGKGNSEVTRMDAMKESIESLLLQLNADALESGGNVRVAVTCFSRLTSDDTRYHLGDVDIADTRDVDAMISDIYSYTPVKRVISILGDTKNARIDVGTAAANNEFEANSPDGNKRYELVYTAGVPTKSFDGSLDLSVADSAISNAYTTKTQYGATVYSVGLFYYADEDHLNGDYFYYNSHPWYKCTGEVGSTWGKSTGYSWFGSRDIDPMDADVTNRMLNYISSNFADATQAGLSYSGLYNPGFMQDPVKWFMATHGPGYRINRNFSRTATGYYYGISPVVRTATADEEGNNGTETEDELSAEALEARFRTVFSNIATGMKAPLQKLESETMLVDGITDYYNLNGDVTNIDAYAANINTGARLSNVDDNISVDLSTDKKTITVTGFDYSGHYIAGSSPAKLVVEFDIKRTDDFIGGNRVPTNTANSAILDKNGRLEERFRIPAIDLYIDKGDNLGKDQSVYYSCEADLAKAFNLDDANGRNNAYSDLVYEIYDNEAMTGSPIGTYTVLHGDSVGTWSDAEHPFNPSSDSISDAELNQMYPQIREDKTYYVKCTVEPWLDGTIDDTPISSEKNVSHVYVFKPQLTASDLRISEAGDVYVDELVNTTNGQSDRYDVLSKKVIEWKHDGETEVPNPTTAPPAIEYKLKDLTHSGNPVYDPFEVDDSTGEIKDLPAINITETTDFQIVDLKIAERTFEYEVRRWIEEDVTYTDEETNESFTEHYEYWGDVSGTKERSAESITFEGTTPSAYYANDKDLNNDSGKLSEDAARPNGKFTILLSKPFTLKVQKEFKGDYAVAGPVTIQVKDSDGILVATKSFAEADFTPLKSEVAEVVLEAGKTLESGDFYTVSETGVDTEFYKVSYAGTSAQGALTANYNDQTDTTYTFKTDTEDDVVTVVVTNTWKTEKNPPITGFNSDSKFNPFFIAAAIIAALGGTGTWYMVKRKKETE